MCSCHQIEMGQTTQVTWTWSQNGPFWVDSGSIWDDIHVLIYYESYNMIYTNWRNWFRLIECDVFSCSSYGNDIVFCQVNQFYLSKVMTC